MHMAQRERVKIGTRSGCIVWFKFFQFHHYRLVSILIHSNLLFIFSFIFILSFCWISFRSAICCSHIIPPCTICTLHNAHNKCPQKQFKCKIGETNFNIAVSFNLGFCWIGLLCDVHLLGLYAIFFTNQYIPIVLNRLTGVNSLYSMCMLAVYHRAIHIRASVFCLNIRPAF